MLSEQLPLVLKSCLTARSWHASRSVQPKLADNSSRVLLQARVQLRMPALHDTYLRCMCHLRHQATDALLQDSLLRYGRGGATASDESKHAGMRRQGHRTVIKACCVMPSEPSLGCLRSVSRTVAVLPTALLLVALLACAWACQGCTPKHGMTCGKSAASCAILDQSLELTAMIARLRACRYSCHSNRLP